MSKSLKKSIIIILITVAIVAILSPIFPKIVNAGVSVGSGNNKDISGFKLNDNIYISKDDLVNNKNIFCSEHGQDLFADATYTVSKKVELKANGELYVNGTKQENSATILAMTKVFKVLAYDEEENLEVCKLSKHKNNNIGLDYRHTNDEYDLGKYEMLLPECARQEFLWQCLLNNSTALSDIFGNNTKGSLNHCWHYNPNVNSDDPNPFTLKDDNDVSDYSKMVNWNKNVCGTIYILSHSTRQDFIITDAKVVDTPTIQLTFKKTDISGSKVLGGAEIEITGNNNVSMNKATLESSSTDGKFGTIEVTPTENTGEFKLNIKETTAPTTYNRVNEGDNVVLTVTYNTESGAITGMSVNECSRNFAFNNSTATITLKDDSRIIPSYTIVKEDFEGNKLQGAEFSVYFNNVVYVEINGTRYSVANYEVDKEVTDKKTGIKVKRNGDNRLTISGLVTNSNGQISINKVGVKRDLKTVYMKITETKPKDGYGKLPKPLWLMWRYNNNNNNAWTLFERSENGGVANFTDTDKSNVNELDSNYWKVDNNTATITLKNKKQIDKLTILKTNAQNNGGLQGAKFNITISNVKSIKGYSANSDEKIILTNVETNSNGNIVLENLVMADPSKSITIQVEETGVPGGYKKINGKMTITITRNGDSYTIVKTKDSTVLDSEFTAGTETVSGHEIALGIKNIPNLSGLNLSKKDFSTQKGVANAEFKVEFENVKSVGATSATNGKVTITTKTDSNGNFVNAIENIEILDPTKNIVVKVTETAAPIEHKQIDGTIRFEVKLTGSTYSIENVSKSETILDEEFNSSNLKLENNEIVLGIKNIPNIKDLAFSKKDFSNGKGVANAEFKVEFENVKSVGTTNAANGKITITTKTDANGNFINAIENIEILDQTKNIVVKVTETAAPIEHKQIDGTIRFEIKLSKGTYIIENISKSETILDEEFVPANLKLENYVIELNIKNILNIQELALNKTEYNSQNTAVAGAEFKLEFENVESVGTRNATAGKIQITTTTDANGNFKDKIEYIEILDTNNPITIKVTETKAPVGYKKLEGTIEFKVKLVKGNYQIDTVTIPERVLSQEFTKEKLSLNNYKVSLNIQDVPVMNLGGVVWEDTQTGIKEVQGPDGKYNNAEKGISGIVIKLYKNGKLVTQDMYGDPLMTKTASEGAKLTYKLHNGTTDTITLKEGEYIFPNLEKGSDYYVEFTYDGINYKTVQLSGNIYNTTNPKESKVEEVNRNAFNAKFKTISDSETADSSSTSYATASSLGGDLSYVPTASVTENGVKTSKLVTRDASGNVLPNYQMKAKSKNYLKNAQDWLGTWTNDGKVNRNSYALDINCGLTYRFFDLAIGMDIEKAELTINGKSTTYDYNQILDGELSDLSLDKLLNENVSNNMADKDNIIYNLYLYYSDYYYRISDYLMEGAIENNTVKDEENDNQVIKGNVNEEQELKAFVTYKVIIKNQSTIDKARVEKLAYYYDTNYEFASAKDAKGNNIVFTTTEGIKTIKNAQNEEVEKKYAEISGFAQDLSRGNDYRQELYLTFEVKKSEDGTRSLPKDVECANVVEILSYSTDEGFVDNDSCPGNIVAFGYEDDTDEAQGINIKLREEVREIAGTVFEDLNKDGKNNDSKPVNDVIVQLIEVKQINGKYYEYIWQETRSGSNLVKTTAKNGYPGTSYEVNNQTGQYKFKEFIPGNYIVRFIYGDGTTYNITPNVQKYNGQDYQSTIDPKYKASWYNTAGYEEGESVARDNEARRLEVMAYSAIIDKAIGEALENKTALDKTWMAAETSTVNVVIDAENKATSNNNTTVTYNENIDANKANNTIALEDINFGLALRPQNKLILEKHITGLKITPNGTGVQPIVDAKATISDIVNDINVKLDGIKTGLTAIKSVRDNRGFWKVETDIEELAQGAQLEVEYTYVVRNESDIDYLSSTLVEQYQSDALGYSNYLKDLKKSVKAIMRTGQYAYSDSNTIGGYLGQFYYTGNKAGTDKLVSARAETLKESLNEQLAKQQTVGDYFNAREFADGDVKTYIDRDGNDVSSGKEILTVIESKDPTKFLIRKAGPDYTENDTDWTKTAKITTVLSAVTNGEIGGNYPSYIAEIISYSNAAGRRNMEVEPENLSYVHSEDTTITMNSGRNEEDEFWGESIIISKPTGEDKQTGVQIAIITTISVAILGLGIVLIKKFVLKK